MASPADPKPSLVDETDDVFADDGRLARALPGFEPRPAQREMAGAVAATIDAGGTALVEAGTGTGKTLAYLVPAILSGKRVLVSTGTKNLQEQIVEKDLPVLEKLIDRKFTVTVMKGRGNYLCRHRYQAMLSGSLPRQQRLGGFGHGGTDVDERILLPIFERWVAKTATGDRAELRDLPEDLPIWSELSASAENCLGATCPQFHECYVTLMRQRAADSDLVVVNHHLLFADAAVRQGNYGAVIPERDVAILDEAHQLEDVATNYFGLSVSNYRVTDLTRDVERAMEQWPAPERRDAVRRMATRVEDRGHQLFDALQPRRRSGEERVRVTADAMTDVQPHGQALIGTLEGLEAQLQLLKSAPSEEAGAVRPAILDDLQNLAGRIAQLRIELAILLRASDPDFVFFLETRGRGLFLRAAPIDVSRIVREELVDHFKATVLTSATMAVDGGFDYIRSRLGIRHAEETRLSSEFDYSRQTVLYLPRRMPLPKDPAFADAAAQECLEILQRTQGRAFVLFTSYAMLRAVEPHLRLGLRYPILVQGSAPRGALLDEFRLTPHAVLLATSSFWQGVDVVGEQLSCVIVDKLPFASPGDPVTAARMEALEARGGDPFGEFQVPLAILTLLQGLGRLIRHRTDRGVLAILDPRIRSMGYGRRFLASLPPAPVVHDLEAIRRFFGR